MPSPLVEAGIEQQACLGLYRFHEAVKGGFDLQQKLEKLSFGVKTEVELREKWPSWPISGAG